MSSTKTPLRLTRRGERVRAVVVTLFVVAIAALFLNAAHANSFSCDGEYVASLAEADALRAQGYVGDPHDGSDNLMYPVQCLDGTTLSITEGW